MSGMLTTIDNPFNYFTHFKEWRAWDERHGYNTLSLLARIVVTSDELSEADEEQAIDDAIDEIVSENTRGMFTKVYESGDVGSKGGEGGL